MSYEIETKMAAMSARFAASAGIHRATIAAGISNGDRAGLAAQAHKLAGIAPMFGYPQIGDAALALEEAVETGQDLSYAAQCLDQELARVKSPDNF